MVNEFEDVRKNIIFNLPCFLQIYDKKHKEKLVKLFINILLNDFELFVRL